MLNERGWVSYYIFKLRLYYVIDFFSKYCLYIINIYWCERKEFKSPLFLFMKLSDHFKHVILNWFWNLSIWRRKKSIEKRNPGSTTISLTTLEKLKFLFTKFQKTSKKHYECCRLDHFQGHKSNRSIWTQNYLNIP